MAQLAEAEFCFAVSPLLCFLPNSDGLSHEDDPRFGGRPLGAPPVHAGCGLRDVFAAVPLHTMSPAPPAVTLDGRKRDGNFTNIQYMVILPISTGNQTHARLCMLSVATQTKHG
ncbi:hypothetical protein PVAP13_6KG031600 [Panicum virgatum]|uniref:Uncharacterized protein n=1 Tax=Panicum virgatum TaxID=38727 RepID=A0A8T0R8W0_PANVG|nr:hypothetical protein PVAP13_6KG031600 [Panicum virgatum]